MYYRISKNEKNLFFGKKFSQVWAVTLNTSNNETSKSRVYPGKHNYFSSKCDWSVGAY